MLHLLPSKYNRNMFSNVVLTALVASNALAATCAAHIISSKMYRLRQWRHFGFSNAGSFKLMLHRTIEGTADGSSSVSWACILF